MIKAHTAKRGPKGARRRHSSQTGNVHSGCRDLSSTSFADLIVGDALALLDFGFKLVTLAADHVEIVIGQLARVR
jgi:hypothetical protein